MRAVIRQSPPGKAIKYIATALEDDLALSERLLTLFLAQLDSRTRRLRYIDAGHGLALIRRADGNVEKLQARGLPLGVSSKEKYQEGVVTLEPGDIFIVYSDGLVNTSADSFYEIAPVADQLYLIGHLSAEEIISQLTESALSMGLQDDLTVVVVRCCA
jgi:serine phosphatase RsbU (regulator of sigma subunit)